MQGFVRMSEPLVENEPVELVAMRSKHEHGTEGHNLKDVELSNKPLASREQLKRQSAPPWASSVRNKSDSSVTSKSPANSLGMRRRIFSNTKQGSFDVPDDVQVYQPEDNVFSSGLLVLQRSVSMPTVLPDVVPGSDQGSTTSHSSPDVLSSFHPAADGQDEAGNISQKPLSGDSRCVSTDGCVSEDCVDGGSMVSAGKSSLRKESNAEISLEQKQHFEGSVCYDGPVEIRRKKSVTFERSVSNEGNRKRSEYRDSRSSGYGSQFSEGSQGSQGSQGSFASSTHSVYGSVCDDDDDSSTRIDGSVDGDRNDDEHHPRKISMARSREGSLCCRHPQSTVVRSGSIVQDTQEMASPQTAREGEGVESEGANNVWTAADEDWQRENSPKVHFPPDDTVEQGDDFSSYTQQGKGSDTASTASAASTAAAVSGGGGKGPASTSDSTRTSPTTKEEYEYDLARQQLMERMTNFDPRHESMSDIMEWARNELPLLITSPKSPYFPSEGGGSSELYQLPQGDDATFLLAIVTYYLKC